MPELDSKQTIYQAVADFVKAKTGKNVGRSGGQDIFNLVVERIFASAVSDKNFRFNGGYGSLRIKQYAAGSRQLPSGQKTTFGERIKLRYEQGVTTTALIDGKPVKTLVVPAQTEVTEPAAPAAKAPAPAAAHTHAKAAASSANVNLD